MTDLANSLAGLSLLSGTTTTLSSITGSTAVETRAQRRAKAAFTTPDTTPPWKATASTQPLSAQASAVKALKTVVDKADAATLALPEDVQTTFTTYKALDRLRVLAESAAKATTSSADRATLQKSFARGLADLKTYLASAPSDKVDLSFAKSSRSAQTVAVDAPSTLTAPTIAGKGVIAARDGTPAGMTGSETLKVTLSSPGGVTDTVTVDLSQAPQPPTLDGVADALNAAIAGVTTPGANGQPVPRWGSVKFEPVKTGDKWGLSLKRAGYESVSVDQVGGADALMVANGVADGKAAVTTRLSRFDDPADAMTRGTLGTIAAVDKLASERLTIAADADKSDSKVKPVTTANAATLANGIVTDRDGFGYVVGTTAGALGANGAEGGTGDDLILTKIDSEGAVVWQRALGAAGSAQGSAVTIAPDGGIVVAGSVAGSFDGVSSDGDMLVAKFDAMGNEAFSTVVRQVGTERATAVAVGADGTILVGGTASTGGGDAVLARFDAGGRLVERRTIDSGGSDGVKALAIAGDGALLALTGEGGRSVLRRIDAGAIGSDLARLDLGVADARAIAVAADGRIAIAGATDGDLAGATNMRGAGRDAFVARVDAGLAGASVTYLASAGTDQADSVAFMGADLYVGGRTSGTLGEAKTGTTDAFVARLDAAGGAIEQVRQYGTVDATSDPVRVAAVAGGDSVLGALGLHRGTLTPTDSTTLEAQTSLRAGDGFAIRVNGGAVRKVTIAENDTLTTLTARIRTLLGTQAANVTNPLKDGGRTLRIDAKPGNTITFVAGAAGADALAKLGLEARSIATPAALAADAPKVRPGGSFGLDLTEALQLDTKDSATLALGRIKQAISYGQSAYRSLYWDDTKAALADASGKVGKTGGSTAIATAQMANYQAALTRLSTTSTGF